MQELLKKIRAARYGKEMREPVATALQEVCREMNKVVENEEVVSARGNYGTLGERLDATDNMIIAARDTYAVYEGIFQKGV